MHSAFTDITVDGNDNIPLSIGQVVERAVVKANNIAIDTNTGSAKRADIEVEELDEDDEVSTDVASGIDDQNNTDDDSEDNPEMREYPEDSKDEVRKDEM